MSDMRISDMSAVLDCFMELRADGKGCNGGTCKCLISDQLKLKKSISELSDVFYLYDI
jgi:hypothetical protein